MFAVPRRGILARFWIRFLIVAALIPYILGFATARSAQAALFPLGQWWPFARSGDLPYSDVETLEAVAGYWPPMTMIMPSDSLRGMRVYAFEKYFAQTFAALQRVRGENTRGVRWRRLVEDANSDMEKMRVQFRDLLNFDRIGIAAEGSGMPVANGEAPFPFFTVAPGAATSLNRLAASLAKASPPITVVIDFTAAFDENVGGYARTRRELVLSPELLSSGLFFAHPSVRFALAELLVAESAAGRVTDRYWLFGATPVDDVLAPAHLYQLAAANLVVAQMLEEVQSGGDIASELARIRALGLRSAELATNFEADLRGTLDSFEMWFAKPREESHRSDRAFLDDQASPLSREAILISRYYRANARGDRVEWRGSYPAQGAGASFFARVLDPTRRAAWMNRTLPGVIAQLQSAMRVVRAYRFYFEALATADAPSTPSLAARGRTLPTPVRTLELHDRSLPARPGAGFPGRPDCRNVF